MNCEGSNKKRHVGDYESVVRIAACPWCGKKGLKITIPDKKMHGNVAKFPSHQAQKNLLPSTNGKE